MTISCFPVTISQADKIKISTNSNAAEKNVVFVDSGTTNGQYKSLQIDNDKTLTFNPDTDTLTATTFAGNLTGTATTATNANNSRIQTNSNNSEKKIVFVGANTSDGDYKPLQVDNNDKLTFNPNTNVLTVANLTVGIGTEEPTTTIGGQPAFVCRHFGRIESDGDISGGTNGGSGTFSSSRTADGVYSISFNTGNKPSDANYCVNVTTLDEGSDHIVGVKDMTVNGFTVRSIDSGAHSGGGESGYDDSPFTFSVFY